MPYLCTVGAVCHDILQFEFMYLFVVDVVTTIMMYLLAGIGLDSSVVPLRHDSLSLIQTTDFFYPLVDNPYIMVCVYCPVLHLSSVPLM